MGMRLKLPSGRDAGRMLVTGEVRRIGRFQSDGCFNFRGLQEALGPLFSGYGSPT